MQTEDSLEDLFTHSKPVRIMVKMYQSGEDKYASSLSSEVDATYSHTVKILQRMERHDLVEFEKSGRKKIVFLTSKGKRLAEIFQELLQEFTKENTTLG